MRLNEPVTSIGVVIPCHNYGRYVREAYESVMAQTLQPEAVVIVNDSSTDNTREVLKEIAASHKGSQPLLHLEINAGSPRIARRTGYDALPDHIQAICCLDADDVLPPEYLKQGAGLFSVPNIGIVHSDLHYFGDSDHHKETPQVIFDGGIDSVNTIHAGSIYRRAAIELADGWRYDGKSDPHEDWMTARRVLACGYFSMRNPVPYRYRRHPDSRFVQRPINPVGSTYYDRAGLDVAEVTIAIPLSGRSWALNKQLNWLSRQTWPREYTRLLLVNTSGSDQFEADLKDWAGFM